MKAKSRQLKEPDGDLSALNAAIGALDLKRNNSGVKPAKDAFGSASFLLATIKVRSSPPNTCWPIAHRSTQDSVIKHGDCVKLGLTCAEVCEALDKGINGRQQGELSPSALETIERLKT